MSKKTKPTKQSLEITLIPEKKKKAPVAKKAKVAPVVKQPYNGIKNVKAESDMSSLSFIYFGSTNLETPGIYGISHLLEHLVCKRFDPLMDKLQEESISWNAYTADGRIVFEFKGLEECLSKFRSKLIKLMYEPLKISAADLKKEKDIVCEEYDAHFTDLSSAHYHLFLRRHYNHFSPIGRKDDILKVTMADCKAFYEKQYSMPDIIINVSKNFVLKDDKLKFASRYWDRKPLALAQNVDDKEIEIINRLISSENKNIFLFKEVAEEDLPMATLVSVILSDGLNSPLYQEVREKRGLVYGISASAIQICALGGFLISSQTSAGNVEAVQKTVDKVLKAPKTFITQSRLKLVLKQLTIQKKIERCTVGDTSEVASPLNKKFQELLKTVKLADVHKFCEKYLKGTKQFTRVEVF